MLGLDVADSEAKSVPVLEMYYRAVLAFVTTIRHPINSNSWARVGELLDATLRSACRQTDDDFRIVVVHNEKPSITTTDRRISFVEVDFPPPSEERTVQIDWDLFTRDKGTKCVIGVAAAMALGADHVMFIDADDLVHSELAAFVNAHRFHPGWYSTQGVIHTRGSRRVQRVRDGFHHKNGSTGIVRTDLTGIGTELNVASKQDEIVERLSGAFIDRMFGQHGKWEAYLAQFGHVIEPLPFPAAVWEIGTGENHSGNLVSGRQSELIDTEITSCFGLELPSHFDHVRSIASTSFERLKRRARGTK